MPNTMLAQDEAEPPGILSRSYLMSDDLYVPNHSCDVAFYPHPNTGFQLECLPEISGRTVTKLDECETRYNYHKLQRSSSEPCALE
jgi:hypothetical protein